MECLSYCVAEKINLSDIEKQIKFIAPVHWQCHRYWGCVEILMGANTQFCYIFSNGTLVCWNVKRYKVDDFFKIIAAAGTEIHTNEFLNPISDEFSYIIGDVTRIYPHNYFHVDCLTLENDDSELKLALSYGLSQSIKLNYYEHRVESLINQYSPLINKLSKQGVLRISRRRIQKILGEMLKQKSEINLTSNFLYQPKFFWQHPNLEPYYLKLEQYLDITKRADTANQKLNTLNEIFLMFSSYLESKHSHRLEIIIIVLIGVEIMSTLLNWHF